MNAGSTADDTRYRVKVWSSGSTCVVTAATRKGRSQVEAIIQKLLLLFIGFVFMFSMVYSYVMWE